MTMVFDGEVFADYFQFYLADVNAPLDELPSWDKDDLRRRLVAAKGAVVFRTAQNEYVQVQVSFQTEEPEDEPDAVHIAECSLETTGNIMIAGCTDYVGDAHRFSVSPGRLRVSFQCVGAGSVSESDNAKNSLYRVKIWPSEDRTVFLKRERRIAG